MVSLTAEEKLRFQTSSGVVWKLPKLTLLDIELSLLWGSKSED